MKTIVIPTDFSFTAVNASNYAIEFAKQLDIRRIVLYNAWQQITIVDPMATLVVSESDSLQNASSSSLINEAARLKQLCPSFFEIEILSELSSLENGLVNLCNKQEISYIVMGITGGSLNEKLVGSNTITVSQCVDIPVIIVPKDCKFSFIKKTLLLCDFKNINSSIPEKTIKAFLDAAQPLINVVNFDPEFEREEGNTIKETSDLGKMLKGYSPEYKYSLRNDFEDAVNEFAEDENAQIVITISKKHSWLYKMLNNTHTKKLAFHTKVPLMIVHA
jgi:hypothetical protein